MKVNGEIKRSNVDVKKTKKGNKDEVKYNKNSDDNMERQGEYTCQEAEYIVMITHELYKSDASFYLPFKETADIVQQKV